MLRKVDGKPVKQNDTSINCLIYADDLVFTSSTKGGLQTCLNQVGDDRRFKWLTQNEVIHLDWGETSYL